MDSTIFFFLVLGGIILLAYTVSYLLNLNKYIAQRNYFKAEMNRSHSKKEYEHWERRLKTLRLKQIPIIGHFIRK